MKVLLVNKFHYKKGGSETYYFTLAKLLEKCGHEVVFFSIADDKNIPTKYSKYFIKNAGLNNGLMGKMRMFKNLNYSREAYENIRKLIADEHPDFAIFNLVHKQISLSIVDALKEFNIPIFWTVHDLIFICPSYTMLDGEGQICEKCKNGEFINCIKNNCIHGSRIYSYLSYREAKFIKKHKLYDEIDAFITPSKFYKSKLDESKLIKSKVIYLPNPCLNEPVKAINKNPDNYLLYFGRLSEEKGIDVLIKSLVNTNLNLYIAGEGPIKNYLINLCNKLKLNNRVKFLGFITGEELNQIIYNSMYVVLPSQWYENGPYSAIEALSFGKPLIVSNYGGLPELIDNNGYVFSSENELKEILSNIDNNSDKDYESMCLNSLNKYKENYYNFDYVKNIMNIYKEAIKK